MNIRVQRIIALAKDRGVKLSFINELIKGYRGKTTEWKNGKSTPTDTEIQIIAEYFGISDKYLTGDTDDPMPPEQDEKKASPEEIEAELRRIMMRMPDKNITPDQADKLVKLWKEIVDSVVE